QCVKANRGNSIPSRSQSLEFIIGAFLPSVPLIVRHGRQLICGSRYPSDAFRSRSKFPGAAGVGGTSAPTIDDLAAAPGYLPRQR
ncbi:MAG: hypothetical protein J0H57_21275, partial [Rhodospirillales bacterium]|nr:hypothetical protein [Rhodospirillales bacterium]